MQLRKRAKKATVSEAQLASALGLTLDDVKVLLKVKREERVLFNPVILSKPTVRDYTHGD